MFGRSNGQFKEDAPISDIEKGYLALRQYATSHVTAASGVRTTLASGTFTKYNEETKIVGIISGEFYVSAGLAVLGAQLTYPDSRVTRQEVRTNNTSGNNGSYASFVLDNCPIGNYAVIFYLMGSGGTATASSYCTRSLLLLEV